MDTEAKRLLDLAAKRTDARQRGATGGDGVYSLLGVTDAYLQRALAVPPIVLPEGTLDSVDALVTAGGLDFLPEIDIPDVVETP